MRSHPDPNSLSPAGEGTALVRVESLTHDGRGIAHVDGKVIFIDGALPGEEIEITSIKKHSKYNEARVLSIRQPSVDRVDPRCIHVDMCGGCSLQHFAPAAQIQFKQQLLVEQLQHFGKVTPQEWLAPLTDEPWGYRRKARLSVRYVEKKQKLLVGFREKNGRYTADLSRCEVLRPEVGLLITPLQQLIGDLDAKREIAQIEVACGETETALILRHLVPLSAADHDKLISFAKQHSIRWYLQPKGLDSIHLLYPSDANPLLDYTLPEFDVTLQFHPVDFVQVNAAVNRKMVHQAIELLAPTDQERVLDLFCGLGNFSLPLAKRAKEVIGVEGDATMVARAGANAVYNNINNATFFTANLAEEDLSKHAWAKGSFDKILIDPPRTGAKEVLPLIAKLKAKRIVYVACHPATLARDAGILVHEYGYVLKKAGVMDMFAHTTHVESMAVFDYGKNS